MVSELEERYGLTPRKRAMISTPEQLEQQARSFNQKEGSTVANGTHKCIHPGYTHSGCPCSIGEDHSDADYYTAYPMAEQHGYLPVYNSFRTGGLTDPSGRIILYADEYVRW